MAITVEVDDLVTVGGQTLVTDAFAPLGIATGAAYADKDAIGTVAVRVTVPRSGIIQSATYYDLDDEGLPVDLWLFASPPGAQTDNSAFALNDQDVLAVIDVVQFSGSFFDAVNCQVCTVNGLGIAYVAPLESIWVQLQARGALNIAAGNLPNFRLRILYD